MPIDRIEISRLLPEVFAAETPAHLSHSEVWCREFAFRRGESYLIRAESGTGKSSLCNFIFGNRTDYRGTISFDGRDIRTFDMERWSNLRRDALSWMPQELALFPTLTVRQNIEIKNRLTGFRTQSWIDDALERMEIADRADAPVGRCSVGQQQRVALIRSLCQPFSFLLLDEPVSHLDERRSAAAAALITEEARRQGAAVIATSVGLDLPLTGEVKILKL